MSEGSEETWKVAGSKRQRGMRSPIQDTPRKKSKANKKVEKEETAEFRASTLVMNTAEWTSEVHAIIALSIDHPTLKIVTKSTGCSTYGPFRGHPGNPVGRKNDNVGPQGKGRGTYDECEDSMGRHTPHINPDRLPRNISSETVYTPDPIRCYRCQKYGHTSRTCYQTSSTCGICAGKHSTAECIEKRKTMTINPKCNNCTGAHTTASKACPVRRQKAQAIQKFAQIKQAKLEQKTTLVQTAQPTFVPTMLDFSVAREAPKSRIPRSATTLKHTQEQTKKITYADMTKDKPAPTRIQEPVTSKEPVNTKESGNTKGAANTKESASTKEPANKQQSTNKAQTTNSTKTPQDMNNPEVHDAYEQILDMLVTQLQQLRPLMAVQDQGAKTIVKLMITSVQTLMTQLAKLV